MNTEQKQALRVATAQARKWERAKEQQQKRRAELVESVSAAHELGVSEYALTEACGVTRMTIRNWLGKPNGRN